MTIFSTALTGVFRQVRRCSFGTLLPETHPCTSCAKSLADQSDAEDASAMSLVHWSTFMSPSVIGLAENRHVVKVNKTSFIHKTDSTVTGTGTLQKTAPNHTSYALKQCFLLFFFLMKNAQTRNCGIN